jgi:1-deoxy-D-xylulose-5-phosphate synthase
VVTVEDGIREGGIGMMIAEHISSLDSTIPVITLGVPTRFIAHASSAQQIHSRLGLDAAGICARARTLCAELAGT